MKDFPKGNSQNETFEKSLVEEISQNSAVRNDLLKLANLVSHLENDPLIIEIGKSRVANPYWVLVRLSEVHKIYDKNTLKNWLTVSLLFFLGLRESEFTSLRPEDFIFSRKVVRVRTLKQKEKSIDYIPLDHIPASVLEFWEKAIYKINKLFNVDRRTVYHRVTSFFGEKVNPHALRHALGVFLYEQTKDIRLTQEILRHKNIANTSIYTKVSKEEIKKKLAAIVDAIKEQK